MSARRWRTADAEATRSLGEKLAGELAPSGILLLGGDLGAGKTVLAQGVARGLGIDPLEVRSPTFIVVREHRGEVSDLIHVDLYRLEPEEVPAVGLEELLAGPGVKVVEWAERMPFVPRESLSLEITRLPEGGRLIAER